MNTVLIANRGEIAVRIIRTCREMGLRTVAVYSEADRTAPHVLLADEAYCIGPPPATESYLNMDALLDVARRSGAQAIHPGYGFLAENPEFAARVEEAGLIFIGPTPETIRLMGSKTRARQAMIDAGVPVVPGTSAALSSPEEAAQVVESIGGYPVLIKAAAGGGGKGMRIVHNAGDLPRALEAAAGEAAKAFGDDSLYIEKFLPSPRHIEIQILADHHGNIIHLWERDCSIQRRHQKLIEECPSAVLTPEQRERIGQIAVQAARACGYRNAGTVEFLYDGNDNFYFLEMNTRLQVEHPVTEMVMGLDLVRLQIEIAAGKPLVLKQSDLIPRGHAIECRINAEDVFNGFVPSTGKITHLHYPQGPGVRVDSGVDAHSEISRYYDPLFAKLIVWAEDRPAAIRRMKRALEEFHISGVHTTIPFHRAVLEHPEFLAGTFSTTFVEQHWEAMQQALQGDEEELAALVAVALTAATSRRKSTPSPDGAPAPAVSPWKLRGLQEIMRKR
ncbi:MAG: acetyl-CoA carboxylase biotin carboxylase subunit [Calditrichaeota bacterium]|nr:MAG: acetyl-CoA carboxylase biotin carboxylase subunit [Calditrichota bacterium]